ncbi:MAG: CAP domain-containing protein [Acidimicrobiia bacterium]
MTTVAGTAPAHAALTPAAFESCLLQKINADRAKVGAPALTMAWDRVEMVRDWSSWMSDNTFDHMTSAQRASILPDGTWIWGENIAMDSNTSSDCSRIHSNLMGSRDHRGNILNSKFRFVALGAHIDSSGWWVTQVFFDAPNYPTNELFIDIGGSVFEADIEWLAARGITKGCNPPLNNRYCPGDPVTREVMAVYIARALELPAASKDYFTDDEGSMFEADINRLARAGITTGCGSRLFCPGNVVDRQQMAAFLTRALGLIDNGGGDLFTDDDWSMFENDIDELATSGTTKGCNPPVNTMYCPKLPVDRGAMAAFLHRAIGDG